MPHSRLAQSRGADVRLQNVEACVSGVAAGVANAAAGAVSLANRRHTGEPGFASSRPSARLAEPGVCPRAVCGAADSRQQQAGQNETRVSLHLTATSAACDQAAPPWNTTGSGPPRAGIDVSSSPATQIKRTCWTEASQMTVTANASLERGRRQRCRPSRSSLARQSGPSPRHRSQVSPNGTRRPTGPKCGRVRHRRRTPGS